MPAKMARSAPRPPFGLAEQPVMRRHLASVLWQGRKTPILTPVRESLRRDNQGENPATIRMRMRRCWGDEGRAEPDRRRPSSGGVRP